MNLPKMAWRNLWRRKKRTYITALTIGFGVMLSVTFTGMGDYSYTKMIDTGAIMGFGHVTVQPAGYNETPSLDKRLSDAEQIRDKILGIENVDGAVIRIMGQAMIASAHKSVGGAFIGIDPAEETPERNLFIDSIVEGALFEKSEGQGALVGERLAEKLNLQLNRRLVYTTTDANGEIVSELARVSGVFRTGVDEVDGAMILLPIDRVRNTVHYGPLEATMVSVVINDQRQAAGTRDTIRELLSDPQAEVLSWRETQPDLAGIITLDKGSNIVIQVLIGMLIAAGILNTLLMSVMERTREFGVMMAVGMSPFRLFRLVILESLWLAFIGLAAGIIITIPLYAYLYNVGIDFSGLIGQDYSASGVIIDPVIRIRLFRESAVAILAGVFILTLISGIYPAWHAGRVPPVESLKAL